MIRVALVGPRQTMRDGLQAIIEADDDLVVDGSFGDGLALLESFQLRCPDVVVTEAHLPDCAGAELTARISGAGPTYASSR